MRSQTRKRCVEESERRSWAEIRLGQAIFVVAGIVGCASNAAMGVGAKGIATERARVIEHEPCDLESSSADRVDVNGDGKPDLTSVMRGSAEICRAVDLDFDGRIDMWTYFDSASKVRRRELDFDRDGIVDEIQLFKAGDIAEKRRASSPAKRLDTWEFYSGGRLMRAERDSDGDGQVDQWWDYRTPDCPLIRTDADGNGQPDPKSDVDYCKESGYKPPEQAAPTAAPMLQKETAPLPTETSSNPDAPASADMNLSAKDEMAGQAKDGQLPSSPAEKKSGAASAGKVKPK